MHVKLISSKRLSDRKLPVETS